MTARAHVELEFARDRVAIYLGHRLSDGRTAMGQPTDIVFQTPDAGEGATVRSPTLLLPEDLARALLDALAVHFGGVSDMQTLRKDYIAERARVDKMIDHLVERP